MYPEDQTYDTIAPRDTMLDPQTDSTFDQVASSAYQTPTTHLYSSPTPHQQQEYTAPTTRQRHRNQPSSSQPSSSNAKGKQKEKEPIICQWCNRVFSRARDYNKHENIHTKPYECKADDPTCTTRTASQKDIDRHYEVRHKQYAIEKGLNPKDITCEHCGIIVQRPDNFLRHLRTQHNIDTTQLKGKK